MDGNHVYTNIRVKSKIHYKNSRIIHFNKLSCIMLLSLKGLFTIWLIHINELDILRNVLITILYWCISFELWVKIYNTHYVNIPTFYGQKIVYFLTFVIVKIRMFMTFTHRYFVFVVNIPNKIINSSCMT